MILVSWSRSNNCIISEALLLSFIFWGLSNDNDDLLHNDKLGQATNTVAAKN